MAQQIIFKCDDPEHAKSCGKDAGEVSEAEFEFEGSMYPMDLCENKYAIKTVLLQNARNEYLATVMEILKPSIDQDRVYEISPPEPEEPAITPASTMGGYVDKYGTALDLAMKSFYATEFPDREQPNPNRKKVAAKFHQFFFDKEDAWATWKEGDLIPEGWIYNGMICKRVPEEPPTA